MAGSCAIVLFTRDLRVHDNPTLRGAVDTADLVVPLFVIDDAVTGSVNASPNRAAFLVDSLRDLDASLRDLGAGGLVVRRGDPTQEVGRLAAELGAGSIHLSRDWSSHAVRRLDRLELLARETGIDLVVHDETLPVVAPGTVTPTGKDHFAVFTPFHRRWADLPRRPLATVPDRIETPQVSRGTIPSADSLCAGERAAHLPEGGESAGRRRARVWLSGSVTAYDGAHDDLAGDETSRLSPHLHFGCVSPVELIAHAGRSQGADAFVRQLAWRDFHLQVLAARPDAGTRDYRPMGDTWRRDETELAAWREGRTGFPIVDAAMRQLLAEGWMHNRARLVVGSFLAKTLHLDWRDGARHFMRHLVDGDVSNNQLNWQWVAGTGTDSRPNRVLNPLRQAERFDPDGAYVRRHVPELAAVAGAAVHAPWDLPDEMRARLDYPRPIVDLSDARQRFLANRGKGG